MYYATFWVKLNGSYLLLGGLKQLLLNNPFLIFFFLFEKEPGIFGFWFVVGMLAISGAQFAIVRYSAPSLSRSLSPPFPLSISLPSLHFPSPSLVLVPFNSIQNLLFMRISYS